MLLVNAIISALLQVLVFTGIPFIVYLIAYRRAKGFFDYIGLRKPERLVAVRFCVFTTFRRNLSLPSQLE